jgi:hypothetical protein
VLPPKLWGNKPTIFKAVIWLLPLVLWGTLWLSIQSGDIDKFFKPDSFSQFLKEGTRAAFPTIAGSWALALIATKLYLRRSRTNFYLSPIGLLMVYGLVGFASAPLSLDSSYSLYWTGAYISVPLVLLALIWDGDGVDKLNLLLNLTWFIILLAAAILFVLAIAKLDLRSSILNPIDIIECKPIGHWYSFSNQVLRSTGVGRYAAISAIIAISFIWRMGGWKTTGLKGYSRILWGIVLVGALILLMSTGARTSIVGFTGAILVILLLYGGKKGVLLLALTAVLTLTLGWSTGFQDGFFNGCIFKNYRIPAPAAAPIVVESDPVITVEPITPTPKFKATVEPITPTPKIKTTLPPVPPTPQTTLQIEPTPPSTLELKTPEPITPAPTPKIKATLPPVPPTPQTTLQIEPTPPSTDPWNIAGFIGIPRTFFSFSGRSGVWKDGLQIVGDSPILGHGFQSDRLLLGTHIHNAFLQSLIQTGTLGATVFMAGVILAGVLMLRAIKNQGRLPAETRHTVILSAGLLIFLGIRSITESTGAFFGVDWLILAPILLYTEVVSRSITSMDRDAIGSGG